MVDPISISLLVKEGFQSLSTLVRAIRDYQVGTATSLTQFLKTTSINSITYIDEQVCEEDIMLPLIGMLNQLYVAQILTTLQLNQYVTESSTVRNILEFVATEDYSDPIAQIMEGFGDSDKIVVAMEGVNGTVALENKEQKLMSGRLLELTLNVPSIITTTTGTVEKGQQTTSRSTTSGSKPITVSILVQLIPKIITTNVTKEFLSINFSLPKELRKRQYLAGQITKDDFYKELDLLANQRRALQEDRTGMLYDMLKHSRNSMTKAFLRMIGILPSNVNSANTIAIVDQRTIDDILVSKGFDLSQDRVRKEFFQKSMVMFLVIVDSMYRKITIYFNGLDQRGEYSFKMIESNAGAGSHGNDKYDLKDIMGALSNGMVPHFR